MALTQPDRSRCQAEGVCDKRSPPAYLDPGNGSIDTKNNIKAATTMLGPAGMSSLRDPKRPRQTAATPTITAMTVFCSGEVESRRAAAPDYRQTHRRHGLDCRLPQPPNSC